MLIATRKYREFLNTCNLGKWLSSSSCRYCPGIRFLRLIKHLKRLLGRLVTWT